MAYKKYFYGHNKREMTDILRKRLYCKKHIRNAINRRESLEMQLADLECRLKVLEGK